MVLTLLEPKPFTEVVKFYSSKDCSGVICKKVKYESDVNDCGLSADFTFKTDGNTVIFNAVSNDSLSKYLWSVTGQNKQYHGKDIKIAFEKNGTYEVCLIVVNSEETCKIQICKKVEIGTTCDVDIDFKYETSDNFIKLLARSSAEGNEKYFWSFGNGDTAAGKKVGYKYDKPGVYEICLKVVIEDPKDPNVVCTKTICKKVTINALNTECNIKADFRVKTDGLTAILSGISSELDATYTWYVNGLKDQYSGKDVKILFPKEGVYEVCLIVVNRAQTCKVQVCNKVEIKILSED